MLAVPRPYSLRPMTVADIPAVLHIHSLSFPSPATEQQFRNELTDNNLAHYQALARAGEAAETIVGYAGFWNIADEIHISTIAVHPDERGRGRGEWLLLNLLLEACRMSPLLVTLEVRPGNKAAQALYRKYRFEEVGLRRRYYRDTGEDAILMTVDFAATPNYCDWLRERAEQLRTKASDAV